MAARGLGQAGCVDQAQVARVVKIGKGRQGVMEAEIHVGHLLCDHPTRRIAFAQNAQVFGAGGDQVFIRGWANQAQACLLYTSRCV